MLSLYFFVLEHMVLRKQKPGPVRITVSFTRSILLSILLERSECSSNFISMLINVFFNLYLAEQEGSQLFGTCVLCTHEKFVSLPDWKIGDSEYASICFHHLVVWQRVRYLFFSTTHCRAFFLPRQSDNTQQT